MRLASTRQTSVLAPPLPIRNKVFDQLRLYLRLGQFTILGAAPSVGKSIFARNLVVKTAVPSLYLSADSDEYTVKTGVAACLTGQTLEVVEKQMEEEAWDNYYLDLFTSVDHVDWCFNPDIDLDFLENRMNAYAEIEGDYPKLLVIDNLSDMVTDEDGDIYVELRRICRELRVIARKTHCHILALHHLTGEYEDGLKTVTLKSFEGKVGKVPENALGMYWGDKGQQQVILTVPKARGTKRGMEVPIKMDYERALIGDFW